MSLYGALFSGVSGLTAQSSAMGAISDNITNVSTIGYKNTRVNFQTLVTKQTSSTFYSAGGVQSKPRQATDVQGLLQASTSQTDISISGQGFFVVNEVGEPGISNQYMYTRSGSFKMDNEGYLRNTSGYYLQGWPTNAAGTVVPANDSLTIANQNIISTDYLETVNLNRVGGTAAATSTIAIGANLPATDTENTTHKTDVQFFDTLGNANSMSFVYTRSGRENQWDMSVQPPQRTAALTIEDEDGNAYQSVGQLEFTARPADGATVVIEGQTYEFDSDAATTAGNVQVDISATTTVAQDVAALVAAVKANDSDFADYGGYTNTRIAVSSGSSTTVVFTEDGTRAITVNPAALLDTSGDPVTNQTSSFTVRKTYSADDGDPCYRDFQQFTFAAVPANASTMTINGIVYTFSAAEVASDNDATIRIDSVANMLADLEASIEALDPDFAGTRVRVRENNDVGSNNTLVLASLNKGTYDVVFGATMGAGVPTEPDGTATYAAGDTVAVNKTQAIVFDSDGLPLEPGGFNVAEIEILGFASGAADMDDDAAHANQITVDFGQEGEANGMTQFGEEFTPSFITQNGSRFGTFAGVTVDTNGLVTALFDNGEIRNIYQLPIATFVNPNSLEGRSGNVWNATQDSGDYTLRVADNGPAGQVIQGALEASTVDIGEEFTNMIVVQRAYSASAKIISTADEMLSELMQVKR
ncbi:MAG: flagellar hook-basal body complex protein [Magnetospirillum sp. WYHS-4]